MNYQRPRGTTDLYYSQIDEFNQVCDVLRLMANFYSLNEIQTPTFEHLELFNKSVGETSDIVTKELYSFQDKGERWLALRPEGTAGVIRAYVENKLYGNQNKVLKFFYLMNLFRYERPQGGRMREFHQFGIEFLGVNNYLDDVEVVIFADNILNYFKIKDIELHINNLGNFEQRLKWMEALKIYFKKYQNELSPDSLKRLDKNPLRILDDKVDGQKPFVKNAPKLTEFLNDKEKEYFENIKIALSQVGIKYIIDETLVRGLDYYTGLVFEFVSTNKELVGKATIIGGGRYAKLIEDTGGPANYEGIGFAIGIERLIIAIKEVNPDFAKPKLIDIVVATDNKAFEIATLALTCHLRNNGLKTDCINGELKREKNIRYATQIKAQYIIFIDQKINDSQVVIENLKSNKKAVIQVSQIADYIKESGSN